MILANTGLPGAGKSLSALSDYLIPALRAGRHVYTNIAGLQPLQIANYLGISTSALNRILHRFSLGFDDVRADKEKKWFVVRPDGSRYYANVQGMDKLLDDVMQHNEALFIIDECHEYLAPENWKLLGKLRKYLSMARHYGHDVLLITQHIDDIWQPIKNRVHETHNFVRGVYGSKSQYTEIVYHGWNIYKDEAFRKQRKNDTRLYVFYASHDNGAKEHLGYISIWQNKKFLALVGAGSLMVLFGIGSLINKGGISGMLSPAKSAESQTPERYDSESNVVYVRYVVCDATACRGVRPDNTVVTLPLDYDSGKYPYKIMRVPRENPKTSIVSGVIPER